MDIISLANEYGADVVSIKGDVYLVLYETYSPPVDSTLFIDSYYPAYQRVRKRKWALKEALKDYDIEEPTLPYKDILEADGCIRGKHTICLHEKYGSFFTVEIIKVNGVSLPDNTHYSSDSCGDCRECIKACPTHALTDKGFNRDICIRELQDRIYIENEKLAKLLGNKVLGCNECQKACPKNTTERSSPVVDEEFFYDCVKGKKAMEKYVDILGRNYLRPARFIANCLNAFINNKDYSKFEIAEKLLDFPDERVVLSAKRYLKAVEENAWEWELKYLVSEDTYSSATENAEKNVQTNYYFLTDDLTTGGRIREKNGAYEFTYKVNREDGKGRIELNKAIDEDEFRRYVVDGITEDELKKLTGADLKHSLKYVGQLVTFRSCIVVDGLKYEWDKNVYLDYVDYEVECEVKTPVDYKKAEEYLSSRFTLLPSKTKVKRFVERYKTLFNK
ncbi:MAG: CYTH domain-containing protein [Clostridia bacterium]|nr:CYTH domain-containing protein [Clostridia bacterium]